MHSYEDYNIGTAIKLLLISRNNYDVLPKIYNYIDWDSISKERLPIMFAIKCSNYLNWNIISNEGDLYYNFAFIFKDKLDWTLIETNQKLSPKFLDKFKDKITILSYLLYNKHLDKSIVLKYQNKYYTVLVDQQHYDFNKIIYYNIFTEKNIGFIKNYFQDNFNWFWIDVKTINRIYYYVNRNIKTFYEIVKNKIIIEDLLSVIHLTFLNDKKNIDFLKNTI